MAEKEMKDFAARAAAFLGDETIADEVIAARNATKTARSLAQERAKRGLSQKEVALRMGVSQSKVCRMEDALDADLSYGDIESYAHALGLDVSLFYDAVSASKEMRAANFANAIADMIDKLRSLLPEDSRYGRCPRPLFRGRTLPDCERARCVVPLWRCLVCATRK